jgi:hypothetical protein
MGTTLLFVAIAAGVLVTAILGLWLRSRKASADSVPGAETSAETGPRTNWLIGTKGEVAGKAFHVGARTVTLGRAVGNFVQLLEAGASRRHVQLSPEADGLLAVDLRSRNGTFVDGERISSVVLHDGALLRIGNAEFQFRQNEIIDIEKDVCLGARDAGPRARATTLAADGTGPKELAMQAVAAASGDLDKAARRLGIDRRRLEAFLREV